MTIKEIGGEFAMIRRIAEGRIMPKDVVKGIGDDCAVINGRDGLFQLVTTDMMVENDHFSLKWHSPYQVGRKLLESNVSDIVCKGGIPRFAFLSMSLTKDTSVEFIDGFYEGLYAGAEHHGVALVGGDTTHGSEYVFNLTLLGEVSPLGVRLRSGARVGELICSTGLLGGSTAGLKLLLNNKTGFLSDHLNPRSREVWEGQCIASFAGAMIDVSDGLASEVKHIARESGTGAVIFYEAIPMKDEVREAGLAVGEDPADFALYGGEDFEIVFTLPEDKLEELRSVFSDFTVVGRILEPSEGVFLLKEGKKEVLKEGYNHFS